MSTRTVVHLLRHGEVHNPEKVLYGRIPGYQLSALGEQMAVRAAEALAADILRSSLNRSLKKLCCYLSPFYSDSGIFA